MPVPTSNLEFDAPANTPVNAWATGTVEADPGITFTGSFDPTGGGTYYNSPTIEISPGEGGPSFLSLGVIPLLDTTDWYTGYRPGQVILTFTSVPTSGTITVNDSSFTSIGSATISASLEYTIPLTFTTFDLGEIYIDDTGYSATWKLTNINFESVTADFWTNFVGTNEIVATGGVCP